MSVEQKAETTRTKVEAVWQRRITPSGLFILQSDARPAGNGVIVSARYKGGVRLTGMEIGPSPYSTREKNFDYKTRVYFPKPEEAPSFASTISHLPHGVVAEELRGAAGVLHALTYGNPAGSEPNWWSIRAIHGCYKRGAQYGLGYTQYKPHREWKEHLLHDFFREAEENCIPIVELHMYVRRQRKGEPVRDKNGRLIWLGSGNDQAFAKVATSHQYAVTEEKMDDPYFRVFTAKRKFE